MAKHDSIFESDNSLKTKEAPEAPPAPKSKEKSKPMQTVYTHGKVFKIPADKNLDDFLKEKYPEEYK